MPYNSGTDFLGLWRSINNGDTIAKLEMPGLDYLIMALGRIGLINVMVSTAAPTASPETTVWMRPAVPSYSAEGRVYLWNAVTNAYEPATPSLFSSLLLQNAGTVQTSWYAFSGSALPAASIGINGDFAIRTDFPGGVYGPKAFGQWPTTPLPGTTQTINDPELDAKFGSVPGTMIYRGATTWRSIPRGALGNALILGTLPAWAPPLSYITTYPDRGDNVLIYDPTLQDWIALPARAAPADPTQPVPNAVVGNALSIIDTSGNLGFATPSSVLTDAALDAKFGSSLGRLAVRGPNGWVGLAAGNSGNVLTVSDDGSLAWFTEIALSDITTSPGRGDGILISHYSSGDWGLLYPRAAATDPAQPSPDATVGNLLSVIDTNGTLGFTAPAAVSITDAMLDAKFGSTQGTLIYRGANNWAGLGVGTNGQHLTSNGNAPVWTTSAAVSLTNAMLDAKFGSTQGTMVYRGANNWTGLAIGTSGQQLTTDGSIPTWTTPAAVSLTDAMLDAKFGSTQGTLVYRGVNNWTGLAIGTSGQQLTTDGSVPVWTAPATVSLTDAVLDAKFGSTQGTMVYRGANNWFGLAIGTNGQHLLSNGTIPQWTYVSNLDNVSRTAGLGFGVLVNNSQGSWQLIYPRTAPADPTQPVPSAVVGSTLNVTDTVGSLNFVAPLIPSGTVMLFVQSSAPTGWTKGTNYNDCALRLVTGTVGTEVGGYPFSTIFPTTQTLDYAAPGTSGTGIGIPSPLSTKLNYVDVIMATKD